MWNVEFRIWNVECYRNLSLGREPPGIPWSWLAIGSARFMLMLRPSRSRVTSHIRLNDSPGNLQRFQSMKMVVVFENRLLNK